MASSEDITVRVSDRAMKDIRALAHIFGKTEQSLIQTAVETYAAAELKAVREAARGKSKT